MPVEIKILSTDCPRCKQLASVIDEALKDVDRQDIVSEKVDDLSAIASYGILAVPGLVINGKLKSAGNVPSKAQIVAWINEERKG